MNQHLARRSVVIMKLEKTPKIMEATSRESLLKQGIIPKRRQTILMKKWQTILMKKWQTI